MLEDNMVKVGKRAPKINFKRSKVSSQKKLTMVQCWLTHGQKLDEEMQLILWTERSTGALVGAGSLWLLLTK
jgi:hypothetical protein